MKRAFPGLSNEKNATSQLTVSVNRATCVSGSEQWLEGRDMCVGEDGDRIDEMIREEWTTKHKSGASRVIP